MGILSIHDALALDPDIGITISTRVSSYTGGAKVQITKMKNRVEEIAREIQEEWPDRRVYTSSDLYGQEKGYMNVDRPILMRAAKCALERGDLLLFPTRNRLIRSALARDAEPTPDEYLQLKQRTFDVVLATWLPPESSAFDQRSFSITRGKPGPKSKAREKAWKVFVLLGYRKADGKWENSLDRVAELVGVGKGSINRLLDEIVPPEFVDERAGVRWRDLPRPIEVFRMVEAIRGPEL